jgi:hypothetical protein
MLFLYTQTLCPLKKRLTGVWTGFGRRPLELASGE